MTNNELTANTVCVHNWNCSGAYKSPKVETIKMAENNVISRCFMKIYAKKKNEVITKHCMNSSFRLRKSPMKDERVVP
jgi:hypothetical protein